jgi:hypothetical protein
VWANASGLQHHLDAAVLLVAEGLVEIVPLFEGCAVRNDERGINLALFDTLQQQRQVVVDGRPSGMSVRS